MPEKNFYVCMCFILPPFYLNSVFSKYQVPKSEFLGTDADSSDYKRIFFQRALVQLNAL